MIYDESHEFNSRIVENCESIRNRTYRPNLIINNRHIQGIYNINQPENGDLEFKIKKVNLNSKIQDERLYDINDKTLSDD